MMRGLNQAYVSGNASRARRSLTLLVTLLGMVGLACRASAQIETLGGLEFYGLKQVSEGEVREAVQLKEGDAVPATPMAMEAIKRRLLALPGVQDVTLNRVCCVQGKTVFFVGIEEKGRRALQFRVAPQGKVRLDPEVVEAGEAFNKALTEALTQGDTTEDETQGYALMHYPGGRAVQERFLGFARPDPRRFQDVLRHSSDASHRAWAAQVLGYAAIDNQKVIDDLVFGMSDPDSNVRNNAMRALAVRAVYLQDHPNVHVHIPSLPFVRLLNSLDWTDRNKAGFALIQLSRKRDVALLKSLRKEALPALIEMAHWTRSGYGQPAFVLLGRMVGLSDEAIFTAWQQGDYAKVLTAIRGS